MDFQTAVKTCFNKYADFNGTASLSEFWWWGLFTTGVSLVLQVFHSLWAISAIFSLATFVPSIAVAARRLHDTDRSGWLQLLLFIPVIGWIVLLVFYVQKSVRPNRYAAAEIEH